MRFTSKALLSRVVLGLLAVALGLGIGCESEPEEYSDPEVTAAPANPDGEPYPTDGLGGLERKSNRPGDRIPNFGFMGYRDGNRAAGLQTISMADYYDPKGTRNLKVLHLQFAATWCAICSSEVEATVPVVESLKERGIAFLEVVVSGPTAGKGPSLPEFEQWVDRHKANFTVAIDVRGRRSGAVGVNGSAMPHDMLIDLRTMEILESSVGAPVNVEKYATDGLKFVTDNPPSY